MVDIKWKLLMLTSMRIFIYIQRLCHEQDVTQGQFLSGVQLVWMDVLVI